jgi:hypothetical protein
VGKVHAEIGSAERSSKSGGRVSLQVAAIANGATKAVNHTAKGKVTVAKAAVAQNAEAPRPHARALDAAPRVVKEPSATSSSAMDESEGGAFIKALKFKGTKPGYVFKAGKKVSSSTFTML